MGIKERRERERHGVRQGILTAAREIAREQGWSAVTIRRVAERIEYSPPVIYEHFASKEAILYELKLEGFRKLLAGMRAIYGAAESPEAGMLAIAEGYCAFAWHHPELYQVMHGLDGVPFRPDDGGAPREVSDVLEQAAGILGDFAAATGAELGDPMMAVDAVRATLHGVVSLSLACRLPGGQAGATALARYAMQTYLDGWKAAGQRV
jgi:AcrR family transcriptional regulator